MLITTAALLGGLAMSGAGALGSAIATRNAKNEEARNYAKTRQALLDDMYESPLESVSNRALLSQMEEQVRRNNAAVENRAAAGGATFENMLAARDASNKAVAGTYQNILQKEDARRDRLQNQLLSLDAQHSKNLQGYSMQSANNWSQWGSNMASGLIDWGGSFDQGTLLKDVFK